MIRARSAVYRPVKSVIMNWRLQSAALSSHATPRKEQGYCRHLTSPAYRATAVARSRVCFKEGYRGARGCNRSAACSL